ncbi:hypothetical protein JCM10212_003590 [Sporobolomyces blumeae]
MAPATPRQDQTDAAHKALEQMFVKKRDSQKLTSTTKPKEYLFS